MQSNDAAVADAGPLIHLCEVNWLFVLETFSTVWVPQEVANEATRYQPKWQKVAPANIKIEPSRAENWGWWAKGVPFIELDRGEQSAFALWYSHQDAILLCDDLQARIAAQDFGIPIMGTVGLILRALPFKQRAVSEVRSVLEKLPEQSSLYIKPSLIKHVIDSLPEK